MSGVRIAIDPAAVDRVLDAAARGVADGAEFLLEQANRTIPLEEGTMARSGQVTVERSGATVTATVSYDTPYARRQHEDTRLRHAPGRRAKWLERTFDEDGAAAIEHVADAIRSAT